jgi:hypothetical protein
VETSGAGFGKLNELMSPVHCKLRMDAMSDKSRKRSYRGFVAVAPTARFPISGFF